MWQLSFQRRMENVKRKCETREIPEGKISETERKKDKTRTTTGNRERAQKDLPNNRNERENEK